MANFGFSAGDIILVSKYAWDVYKVSKHAGEDFKGITIDVKLLRSHLRTLDEEIENRNSLIHRSDARQRDELGSLLRSCRADLRELEKLLAKYKSLKRSNPRARDKLAFRASKQADIRNKIATHNDRLQRFLNGLHTVSLGRIESRAEIQAHSLEEILQKLDSVHQAVRAGKRDPSVLTDMDDWIKQELVDDNITETDVEVNREEISAWLERLRVNGEFTSVLNGIAEQEENDEDGESSVVPDLSFQPRRKTANKAPKAATNASDLRPLEASEERAYHETGYKSSSPTDAEQSVSSHASEAEIPITAQKQPREFKIQKTDSVISSNEELLSDTEELNADFEVDLTLHSLPEHIMPDPNSNSSAAVQRKSWSISTLGRQLPYQWIPREGKSELEIPLPVTLEEIFNGAMKRVKIKRLAYNESDGTCFVEGTVKAVWIEAGQGNKSRIHQRGWGNGNGFCSQDVIFIVEEKPHALFERIAWPDNKFCFNLRHALQITLCEALCGWERNLVGLDGSKFRFSCPGPTQIDRTEIVWGHGLPLQSRPTSRGNLWVSLLINYPDSLNDAQKCGLGDVLRQSGMKGRFKAEVLGKD